MIKGRKVDLRAVVKEDLAHFKKWRSESWRMLRFGYRPLTDLNQDEFFQKISTDKELIIFTVEAGCLEAVGYVQLYPIDWKNRKAEVGVIINKKYQGEGFAKEALQLIVQYGFKTLGLNKIYAEIFDYNPESIGLFEKVGFKLEGRLCQTHFWDGMFHDSLMYSILAGEKIYEDTSVQTVSK